MGLMAWMWQAVTRLGEAQILLPAFAAGSLWLALARPAGRAAGRADHPARGTACRWAAGLLAAAGLTTASKIAFLGFGIGSAALDFTGFSGHAMFSMAILPVVGALVAGGPGAAGGALLSLVVLASRVQLHAHSWSEALAGAALGALVAAWALADYLRHPGAVRVPAWLPPLLVAWLVFVPWRAPPSRTHSLVVAVALWLGDRTEPYTRHELLSGQIHRSPRGGSA